MKGDYYVLIEDIQISVTAKLKALARAMKRLEDRTKCQETISNKYYLFEFLAFFHRFCSVVAKLT